MQRFNFVNPQLIVYLRLSKKQFDHDFYFCTKDPIALKSVSSCIGLC
jgi:hypothetical protein